MLKRYKEELKYFIYNGEPVKLSLNTLVLMVLSLLLIIMATFTDLNLKYVLAPINTNWVTYFPTGYIPQVPAIFFILGLLDRKFTLITVILYIALGFIGYPIFAMGGGWKYIFQYGVGYIISYIPAVFFAGTILNKNYTFRNIFRSVLAGVIIINIVGTLVLLMIACLRHDNWLMVKNLLFSMSIFKFIYDLVFSVIAVYLAYLTKRIFWVILH